MRVDPEKFRYVMRQVPAPVGVLLLELPDGGFRGMTASSFTSVSLEPPLISVCVTVNSNMHAVLKSAAHFTFNLLGADERAMANHFAGRGMSDTQQFSSIQPTRRDSGALILTGAVLYLHCRNHRQFDAGDHMIQIGEVIDTDVVNPGEPLVVYGGEYASVAADNE